MEAGVAAEVPDRWRATTKMTDERVLARHRLAVALALVFAGMMAIPFISLRARAQAGYAGVLPYVNDDELFYMARIQDVLDGHPTLGNAYLWEHKGAMPLQLFFPEFLLAGPLKLLGESPVTGRVLYSVLLPPVTFLLVYALLYRLVGERRTASCLAAALLFGFYIHDFNRPVSPQFNFPFWLLQLLLLHRLVENPSSGRIVLANAATFGLLFYLYPYYWTYYAVVFAVLAGLSWRTDHALAARVVVVMAAGIVLGAYSLYSVYQTHHTPEGLESLHRAGLIHSRSPSGVKILAWSLPVLAAYVIAARRRQWPGGRIPRLLVASVMAGVIGVNQHLVTNSNVQFSSHYALPSAFAAAFAAAFLLARFLPADTDRRLRVVSATQLLALLVALLGAATYVRQAIQVSTDDVAAQRYGPVLDWLARDAPRDSVVFANDALTDRIPAYTGCNVFFAKDALYFTLSDQEVLDRFLLHHYYDPVDHTFLQKSERAVFGGRYVHAVAHVAQSNKIRRLLGMATLDVPLVPKDVLDRALARFAVLRRRHLSDVLASYRIDYFVWDRVRDAHWQPDPDLTAEIAFENDGVTIYRTSIGSAKIAGDVRARQRS